MVAHEIRTIFNLKTKGNRPSATKRLKYFIQNGSS